MNKNDLRKQYKNKRAKLSEEEITTLSIDIANNSLNLAIWQYNIYHIFLPITSQKEVDTNYLLHILQGKDKEIVVSKTDFKAHSMKHYLLTDNTLIRNNAYGIPEPQNGIEISPKQIEVAFIPLLAYDYKGNRIGYGKGFYDEFLSQCKPDIIKVGLSFFAPEKEYFSDLLHTDIPLDYCITPKHIYSFPL